KWLDGLTLLDERERNTRGGISDARARTLARNNRARYYLTGFVFRRRDSASVQLALHDAKDGTTVAHETETGAGAVVPGDLTLRAVVRVLPKLTGLDRVIDVSGITGRQPAAVHDWLLGEREYRRSNMSDALRYL